MFSLNNSISGFGLPTLHNPLLSIGSFVSLFARPYWYADTAPLLFDILYMWQAIIGPLVVLIGLITWYKQKERDVSLYLFPSACVGFILAAWLLTTFVTFPNVSSAEQSHYPMRLVWSSVLFLLAWCMSWVHSCVTRVSHRSAHRTPHGRFRAHYSVGCRLLVFSSIITISFYLSYPQHNPKVSFPGYNVTDADFAAVQYIHAQNANIDYVVLSNQLTAVAALSSYGFVQYYDTAVGHLYYYSIPSGGPLADLYRKMLYEGQKPSFMNTAMTITHTERAYFVVSSFWKDFDSIVENAKTTADRWEYLNNGRIIVFEYNAS
jgi:hypothetical protein